MYRQYLTNTFHTMAYEELQASDQPWTAAMKPFTKREARRMLEQSLLPTEAFWTCFMSYVRDDWKQAYVEEAWKAPGFPVTTAELTNKDRAFESMANLMSTLSNVYYQTYKNPLVKD